MKRSEEGRKKVGSFWFRFCFRCCFRFVFISFSLRSRFRFRLVFVSFSRCFRFVSFPFSFRVRFRSRFRFRRLGAPRGVSERLWCVFGLSLGRLCPPLGLFGVSLGRLGASSERLWSVFGASWSVLERPGAPLGRLGASFCLIFSDCRLILGPPDLEYTS